MKVTVQRRRDLDESLHTCVFPSGLTAYCIPKRGFRKSFAIMATRYGSLDLEFRDPVAGKRTKTPPGVAHFLEHQLFETPHGNASEIYARLGAHVNAFTSYTTTGYYFTTPQRFRECLDLLMSFVMTPYFTRGGVSKERGIIASEIRGYDDSPNWRGYYNLTRALYAKHFIRIDIAGTVSSIKRITAPMLERCHRFFYNPANMIMCVVGDLDPSAVFSQAGRFLDSLPVAAYPPIRRYMPREPAAARKKKWTERMDVARPKMLLGFKDSRPGDTGRALAQKDVELRMILDLLFGRSSGNYTELYESGLIDDSFGAAADVDKAYGFAYLSSNTDAPGELEKRLREMIRTAVRHGFPKEDFERVKYKALGRSIRHFNSVEQLGNLQLGSALMGTTLFDYHHALENITRPALEKRLRLFFRDLSSAVSLVLPRSR